MAAPSPGKGRKAVPKVFILLALSLVLQCFLWRGKERLQQLQVQTQTQERMKRSHIPENVLAISSKPLNDDTSHQMQETDFSLVGEVSEVEGPEGGIFGVDYWDLYNNAKAGVKPFIFTGFILW
jgi:hypothetical protein